MMFFRSSCRYPTIRLLDTEVEHVSPNGGGFDFRCADGMTGTASTVLFATGLVDTLPTIPGIETFYGSSVHHCVYCDGAEYEGRHWLPTASETRARGWPLC